MANLPSQERAEELRDLFNEHVEYLDPDSYRPWKGRVKAVVPKEISVDVQEAMNFVGAWVDSVDTTEDGKIELFSRGYYHHIGA